MTPWRFPLPTLGNMKHFGLASRKMNFSSQPGPKIQLRLQGHHISNDIFTIMFTARMGRGKIHWDLDVYIPSKGGVFRTPTADNHEQGGVR
jgi:hypothetical protein